MSRDNLIGNVTTIGKIIAMPIAGWAIGFLASKGLNLPIDQQTLSECIFVLILFVWGLFDAKYPNALKIFKKAVRISSDEPVLNDEYETVAGEDDGA